MAQNLPDMANVAQIVSLIGLPLSVVTWLVTKEQFFAFWKKWRATVFVLSSVVFIIGAVFRGWFNWLGFRANVPIWILILAPLVLVSLAVLVVWFVLRAPDGGGPPTPLSYVNDTIFGVRWNWRYYCNEIDVESFAAFCPEKSCRHRLDYLHDFGRARYRVEPITLNCPRCGFRQEFEEDRDGLHRKVAGEVERRINTGEFARPKVEQL